MIDRDWLSVQYKPDYASKSSTKVRAKYTPQEDRKILELEAEGKTYEEIANVLGRPVTGISRRILRIKQKKQKALQSSLLSIGVSEQQDQNDNKKIEPENVNKIEAQEPLATVKKVGRPREIDEELTQRIQSLRKEGKSLRDIAELCGISHASVSNILAELEKIKTTTNEVSVKKVYGVHPKVLGRIYQYAKEKGYKPDVSLVATWVKEVFNDIKDSTARVYAKGNLNDYEKKGFHKKDLEICEALRVVEQQPPSKNLEVENGFHNVIDGIIKDLLVKSNKKEIFLNHSEINYCVDIAEKLTNLFVELFAFNRKLILSQKRIEALDDELLSAKATVANLTRENDMLKNSCVNFETALNQKNDAIKVLEQKMNEIYIQFDELKKKYNDLKQRSLECDLDKTIGELKEIRVNESKVSVEMK